MIGTTEYFIPLEREIDAEGERIRIETDLKYYRGFLGSVMKKLNNERFVKNAPATVLDLERKKKADTELKIKSLEEALRSLNPSNL
jgi:valyl-tRNA synthetase